MDKLDDKKKAAVIQFMEKYQDAGWVWIATQLSTMLRMQLTPTDCSEFYLNRLTGGAS